MTIGLSTPFDCWPVSLAFVIWCCIRILWPHKLAKMDPSLLKEREAFLRHARNMPIIEKPRLPPQAVSQTTISSTPPRKPFVPSTRDYLTMDTRSQNQGKFTLLSRVVKYMKVNIVQLLILFSKDT